MVSDCFEPVGLSVKSTGSRLALPFPVGEARSPDACPILLHDLQRRHVRPRHQSDQLIRTRTPSACIVSKASITGISGVAVRRSELITSSTVKGINVLPLGSGAFDRTCERFARYDARRISFVDHSSGVLADDYDIEHIFTFDTDDFHTLGFVVVPADTGDS